MIHEFKKVWKTYTIGLLWLLGLLWPLLGIHPDGTLSFGNTFTVWLYIATGTTICLLLYIMNKSGSLDAVSRPLFGFRDTVGQASSKVPNWVWIVILLAAAFSYPFFTGRYAQDVATNVLIYVCLGLGLNIVVGLAGMLDLGYIAFYGVGAYTYALLNLHFGMSFWICLPFAAALALTAGCIIGYPTLRMRGDYLAIVTLGFGEIVRILLNNWMSLTNGPNGLLGIKPPSILIPSFQGGMSFEVFYLKKLHFLYYIALALAIVTIIAVRHLNLFQNRQGLGIDPRGRDRRRTDGRQHLQAQAAGLCHGRAIRRSGRCLLLCPHALCQPGKLHLPRIGHGAEHGCIRRYGFNSRHHPGRRRPDRTARSISRV